MEFDTADLVALEGAGLLEEVILHEMGHVLGFGTVWNLLGLLQNPSCGGTGPTCNPDNSGADTHFDGANAITSFDNVGGTAWTLGSKVPVENTLFGRGTRDSHWRESTFVNELMTGLINAGANPLSEVTVASLLDMGYVVNIPGADPYTLGNPSAIKALVAQGFELKNDILFVEIRARDVNGRIRLIDPRR
ncbi:MAG: hypothetical protein E4H37_08025 [Gemmatimonadales bacterium]|nr:MAG: hypothetical protein E4H37_08025 [Gemmatimonadales bacterium]